MIEHSYIVDTSDSFIFYDPSVSLENIGSSNFEDFW